ncbi:flagellar hook-basal body complex protein FliE [Pelagerythrobacter marensis]|uniref:Flagellar hook-basal body complex protein FliE n=1 Tax=Pelagerythrobacter marensis TaxID=543877 RepID=A0ABZ2DB88_9SPHN
MTEIAAVSSAIALDGTTPAIDRLGPPLPSRIAVDDAASFDAILAAGLESVDRKIATADNLVRQFAVDDDIPVHQVTLALEQARMSVELALEVRTRMLETYRELMNMQV